MDSWNVVVRYIGASNVTAWQMATALEMIRQSGWDAFISIQPQYNLLCRAVEYESLPLARFAGLGVLPWSHLRGGWPSGRYQRGMDGPPQNPRVKDAEELGFEESRANYNNEFTWRILDEMNAVARETDCSPAQVSLRWVLSNPAVSAPILGVRTLTQLEDQPWDRRLQPHTGAGGPPQDRKSLARRIPYPFGREGHCVQWMDRTQEDSLVNRRCQ